MNSPVGRQGRPRSYPYVSHDTRQGYSNHKPNWGASFDQHSRFDSGDIADLERSFPQAEDEAGTFVRTQLDEKRVASKLSDATTRIGSISEPHHEYANQRKRGECLAYRIAAIILPICLLLALVLGLVFGLKVRTEQSLFPGGRNSREDESDGYILVHVSATIFGNVTSLLSMLAPILGTLIMGVWRLCTAQNLQRATRRLEAKQDDSKLPRADTFSSLVGINLASPTELINYFGQLLKKRGSVPPVLHKAATMLTFSLFLAGGVFIANTILQYTTQAINFEAITRHVPPRSAFGRGLNTLCLDFNRTANFGFPCTYDFNALPSQYLAIGVMKNEIYLLRQNISQQSEIRYVATPVLHHGDLGVLIPQVGRLPDNIDYRGSTVGVSTQCQAISPKCKMQAIGPQNTYTQFSCTENFWGVLGKQPNSTAVMSLKAEDPSVPPMAFKAAQNLQYAFFADPNLETPYNTEGYNISSGNIQGYNASTGIVTDGLPTLPDADLINPVFVAVAGRISTSDESAGSNLTYDPEFFTTIYDWVDFVLNCSYTTYDVNYTWANGAIQNMSFAPSPNGSLAEMYHGGLTFASTSGGSPDLQANLLRASLQNTSESFAHEWANLYSTDVLSTIGAYTTSRMNIQEQERMAIIVTQVPKAAFYVLLSFSAAYVILGMYLAIVAYRASSSEVWILASQLSLSAIVAAALDRREEPADHKTTKEGDSSISESQSVYFKESNRVRIAGESEKEWRYAVLEQPVSV